MEWLKALKAKLGRPPKPRTPYGVPSYLGSSSFRAARGFVPLDAKVSYQLYKDMRTTFPVLDTAVGKLVRLCGHVKLEGSEDVIADVHEWMGRVQVNALGRGFQSWLSVHIDQAVQFGRSVSELVPTRGAKDVHALMNLDPTRCEFRIVEGDPLALEVVQWQSRGVVVIPSSVALVSMHNPQGDTPHGVSLFRSLPFVAEALSVIENATVQTWQRTGAPSYHVNWVPPADFSDPDGTRTSTIVSQMQEQFQAAMSGRQDGAVHDFFSAGEIKVDLIGSEGTFLELASPFRAFAEQVIAATGLPSWVFGFSWSSTERMAVQQADLLVANIEGIRREVQPALEKLIETRQQLAGGKPVRKIGWSAVNLRDLTEQARAEAWEQQARNRRIENARRMWELGFWDQLQAARYCDPDILSLATAYDTVPASAEATAVGLSPEPE